MLKGVYENKILALANGRKSSSVLIRQRANEKAFIPVTERKRNKSSARRMTRHATGHQHLHCQSLLVGTDPKLAKRTWAFVIQEFCAVKKESTRLRRERAIKSQVFISSATNGWWKQRQRIFTWCLNPVGVRPSYFALSAQSGFGHGLDSCACHSTKALAEN